MAGRTDHYGLATIVSGESFATDGYKYTNADRQTIDGLLHLGAEGHRHTGLPSTLVEPTLLPTLSLVSTGGSIPGGTRVYYKYTYVSSRGEETAASPEAFIDTPAAVAEPSAPTLSHSSTGGTLRGGNYYYVLSEYVGADISESLALNPSFLSVATTTSTNRITLTLPSIGGGDGWNIYRRKPGQTKYFWLDSFSSSTTQFVDSGAIAEDCDRSLPTRNTTNSTNAITATLPGALPAGSTWKLYRTYTSGYWSNSLLHWVVEGSPNVFVTYEDVGQSPTTGTFPTSTLAIGSPSKIDLTNNAEVTGTLPMAAFPYIATFRVSGTLSVLQSQEIWVNEFPAAEIISCRIDLGRDSTAVATPVIVDVNKFTGATPSWTTIFTTQANRPRVAVGNRTGVAVAPNINTLARGDALSFDIDQAGGSATPDDADLLVTISMIAYGYPASSFIPNATPGVNKAIGF